MSGRARTLGRRHAPGDNNPTTADTPPIPNSSSPSNIASAIITTTNNPNPAIDIFTAPSPVTNQIVRTPQHQGHTLNNSNLGDIKSPQQLHINNNNASTNSTPVVPSSATKRKRNMSDNGGPSASETRRITQYFPSKKDLGGSSTSVMSNDLFLNNDDEPRVLSNTGAVTNKHANINSNNHPPSKNSIHSNMNDPQQLIHLHHQQPTQVYSATHNTDVSTEVVDLLTQSQHHQKLSYNNNFPHSSDDLATLSAHTPQNSGKHPQYPNNNYPHPVQPQQQNQQPHHDQQRHLNHSNADNFQREMQNQKILISKLYEQVQFLQNENAKLLDTHNNNQQNNNSISNSSSNNNITTTNIVNLAARNELIKLLRESADKYHQDFELSLHQRRQSIGRIVLIDDTTGNNKQTFGGNDKVEMWYEGTEVDSKRKKLQSLKDESDSIQRTLKTLKPIISRIDKEKASIAANAMGDDPIPSRNRTKKTAANNTTIALTTTILAQQSSEISGTPGHPASYHAFYPSGLFDITHKDYDDNLTQLGVNQQTALSPQHIYWYLDYKSKELDAEIKSVEKHIAELEIAKKNLLRDERLFIEEQLSEFKDSTKLYADRFVLLYLLGKGGFSEVFRAYDINEMRYCAVKIHAIQANWTADKRQSYIKHVKRECQIQSRIDHPHVVKLYEVVVLGSHILMLILEQCNGGDLETYLKLKGRLPEHEAAFIMLQILDGLHFLKNGYDDGKQTVIHYDLKPGNVLFHNGIAKISDFGLSKQHNKEHTSIDLTSQGAGTMGYLPPECYQVGAQISQAVDVWSCGIIMYQMLYGERPFDANIASFSYDIKAAHTVVSKLAFPETNNKNNDLQQVIQHFIKCCLTVDPDSRITVEQAIQHPLFNFSQTTKGAKDAFAQLTNFQYGITASNNNLNNHDNNSHSNLTDNLNAGGFTNHPHQQNYFGNNPF